MTWPRSIREVQPAYREARYRLSAKLRRLSPRLYNKSRSFNCAIRELAGKCDVIVCTDIDMYIPSQLIDISYSLAKQGYHVWCPCRYTDRQFVEGENSLYSSESAFKLPISQTGKGSWNAMTTENWYLSGGWNENMFGWGYEDDAMHLYITSAGIRTEVVTDISLFHCNHDKRPAFYNLPYNRQQYNNRRGL